MQVRCNFINFLKPDILIKKSCALTMLQPKPNDVNHSSTENQIVQKPHKIPSS